MAPTRVVAGHQPLTTSHYCKVTTFFTFPAFTDW
jgi:hypothetical protein